MSIVIDASVAAKWILRDESSKSADAVLSSVSHDGATVPAIFVFEIENISLVAERRLRIEASGVEEALALLCSLDLIVEAASARSIGRFLEIARHNNLSSYDAAYVEAAARLRTPLFAMDKRLADAARDRNISTTLVS